MGFWARYLQKRANKKIRQLAKFYRGPAKFLQRYPP